MAEVFGILYSRVPKLLPFRFSHTSLLSRQRICPDPPFTSRLPNLRIETLYPPFKTDNFLLIKMLIGRIKKKCVNGAFRESNSGPLAPKARIIPLDQMPCCFFWSTTLWTVYGNIPQ